jgi:hypothetical protein
MNPHNYSEQEITKLVKTLIGDTHTTGDHRKDAEVVRPNVELLGLVTLSLVCRLQSIDYSYSNDVQTSVKSVGDAAKHALETISRSLQD